MIATAPATRIAEARGHARTLVIYHGGCPDGWASAWAASRYLGRDEDTVYHAASYGAPPPDVRGLQVYCLDFAYPRQTMISMAAAAKSLQVLDHHASHQDALEDLPFANFDLARSGAGLTWDHFFPAHPRPWLIDYVEDGDLWRWRLKDSREINLYVRSKPYTFEAWDHLAFEGARGLEALAEKGRVIQEHLERQIEAAERSACEGMLFGHRVPAVHTTDRAILSELLNRLARGRPFAAAWSLADAETLRFSLRSHPGGLDVSQLARRFDGGGHKHAAGFSCRVFPRLLQDLLPGPGQGARS